MYSSFQLLSQSAKYITFYQQKFDKNEMFKGGLSARMT